MTRSLFSKNNKIIIGSQNEGTAQPSFIQTLLEINTLKATNGEPIDFDSDDIKGAAGAIYAAGQDTVGLSSTTIHPLILFI